MSIKVKSLSGIKSASFPLYTDLALRIQEDILSGALHKNQKLTEQGICDTYSVSRTPVREAFVQLEMKGLIEIIPNRGAFVVGLSAQDRDDMFVLRKIYEIQATRWAIERITESEMEELEENFEFMEFYTMKNDVSKMLNINQSFHQMIYRASHNRMLTKLLSSYQMYIVHNKNKLSEHDNYLSVVLEEHKAIFNAFKARDPEAGAVAMADHMNRSRVRHQVGISFEKL